jgi:protein TonB
MVTAALTLAADGSVSDVRVLSGPEELRRSVIEAALQWHYLNESKSPGTAQAVVEFRVPEAPPAPAGVPAGVISSVPWTPPPPPPPPPTAQTGVASARPTVPGASIEGFDVSALPEPLQSMVREKLTPFQGRQLDSSDLLRELISALSQVDSHLMIGAFRAGSAPGRIAEVRLTDGTASQALAPTVSSSLAPSIPSTSGVQRLRVGGNVQESKLLHKVVPTYPEQARSARIQGVVQFQVVIGTDGRVNNMLLVGGHPLLVPSAQEAVRQWVYEPTLLNGEPVEVQTQIDVNFTLQ